MIEFEALAIKAEIDDIYAIFLLKKNVRSNIIKTILGYLPIVALIKLKSYKANIILVRQKYKSIKYKQDYKTELEITYKERELFIDIQKANYNKEEKLRYFNCNIYRHITNNSKKSKKEREIGVR